MMIKSVYIQRFFTKFFVKKYLVISCSNKLNFSSYEPKPDYIRRPNPFYSDKYFEAFRRSLEEPETFWAEVGKQLSWSKPWTRVLDNSDQPFTKWFVGGELNACYNAVDRHVENGKGSKVALIHDSPVTGTIRKVTYSELQNQVSHLAGALADLGVVKGDRVLIYMPLIPETIIAMLATVRLGAIHSVVFGGFAARELCSRINHAEPKVIIGASCGVEPNKIVRYKDILNEAIEMAVAKPKKCIIFQRRNVLEAELSSNDLLWDTAISNSVSHPCVPVEANDPLYILYTSGTTDMPKGILRPTGGHIATLAWSMSTIYGMTGDDIWWTASDMGWVVGHSYICYGPLCAGLTSIMYEGKPDRTPDCGQYFRVIQEHQVNAILTAPTALRVIRREDPEIKKGRKYSTKSLRHLFVAGEHCDHETKSWAEQRFKVPILNHWWQTETGHSITANCIGLNQSTSPPKYSTGMPFVGYDVRILRPDGSECDCLELGRIAVKLPLPPGTMATLYKSTQLFLQVYFSRFPGYYDTMDAGYRDEFGYIYVTARDDDVINVAGHRLSTSALEDVVMSHPSIADAAVIGVPEPTKGEIPLCLYLLRPGCGKTEEQVSSDLVKLVRELIGPIAAFRLSVCVSGLPRTRSGKTARKSIADLASDKAIKIPSTIEDPTVYKEIKRALQSVGYAKTAPDPQ
ncbi:acyl-CoA synthetase short-chain family member 3, mitochondrial isoform X2 [Lycorma delicatula]|uniref:acyl-CoA synthetase short-chain family member 3, mitochondrial isoform X2 n=1 Tax=Lycorma delicatula TaxID=130591 RepID=UPI003F50E94E